jgi:hypothetical protein
MSQANHIEDSHENIAGKEGRVWDDPIGTG